MRGILIAAVAAGALASGCSDSPDPKQQAEEICRIGVANWMKDPSSAEFRNITVGDIKDVGPVTLMDDDFSTTLTADARGKAWPVKGEVNANNAFGGKVGFREFTCEATLYDGDTNLKAQSITVDDD